MCAISRPEQVPEQVDFFSVDVSFISLSLVLPAAFPFLRENGEAVCLVKPQFEAGPRQGGEKGRGARPLPCTVRCWKRRLAMRFPAVFPRSGLTYSPVKGPEGNIEYLLYLRREAQPRTGELPDLSELVEESHRVLNGGGHGMKILIQPNLTKAGAARHTARVISRLSELGVACLMEEQFRFAFDGLPLAFCEEPSDGFAACDIVIAVGGDGTIIRSAKDAAAFGKPVLGVNVGRLGFVAGLETDELDRLPLLMEGEYLVDERMMIEVRLEREGEVFFLLRAERCGHGARRSLAHPRFSRAPRPEPRGAITGRMGLSSSTPTGSTAYSLSCGRTGD